MNEDVCSSYDEEAFLHVMEELWDPGALGSSECAQQQLTEKTAKEARSPQAEDNGAAHPACGQVGSTGPELLVAKEGLEALVRHGPADHDLQLDGDCERCPWQTYSECLLH